MNRIEELERLLDVECPKHEDNCKKCPFQKECEEYAERTAKGGRK